MKEKYKNCPFCDANIDDLCPQYHPNVYFIVCGSCGATGPDANSVEESIKFWNERCQKTEKTRRNLKVQKDIMDYGEAHW